MSNEYTPGQPTPGPWFPGSFITAPRPGRPAGSLETVTVAQRVNRVSDMRLIAAAPALLSAARIAVQALAHIVEESPHNEAFYGDAYRALDAAIALATRGPGGLPGA